MATAREVDRLFWAVAEARRQRAQEQERSFRTEAAAHETRGLYEGFVTEWQSAEGAGLLR